MVATAQRQDNGSFGSPLTVPRHGGGGQKREERGGEKGGCGHYNFCQKFSRRAVFDRSFKVVSDPVRFMVPKAPMEERTRP